MQQLLWILEARKIIKGIRPSYMIRDCYTGIAGVAVFLWHRGKYIEPARMYLTTANQKILQNRNGVHLICCNTSATPPQIY